MNLKPAQSNRIKIPYKYMEFHNYDAIYEEKRIKQKNIKKRMKIKV